MKKSTGIIFLVMAILFLGTAITMFILWNKEKKKVNGVINGKMALPKPAVTIVTNGAGVSNLAEQIPAVEVSTNTIADRSVTNFTSASFGSRVN